MTELLIRLYKDESGQDLIEYTLIAALIALACVASMSTLATQISSEFAHIETFMT